MDEQGPAKHIPDEFHLSSEATCIGVAVQRRVVSSTSSAGFEDMVARAAR